MSDSDLKAKWAAITDPIECLEQLSEHSMYLGSDPYYKDMDAALWEMVIRVIDTSKKPAMMRGLFSRHRRSTRYNNKELNFGSS